MPKRKAKFYGVRVGVQPGVYDDWEVCNLQVHGFSGSQHESFPTRAAAENYVNDFLTGHQIIAAPKTEITQSQANTNLDERCKQHPSTIAIEVRTPKGQITTPSHPVTRVTASKEEVTSPSRPLKRVVSIPKEEVTSPIQLSTKDPSNCFKVVEENGHRFVIFESIKKFDSYFEGLCRTRHLHKSLNWKTFCENQEIRIQEQTSDSSQDLQTKVTVEDDEFVYFKDEDEWKRFWEPYFKDAEQNPPGPAQRHQSFDAVAQASYPQQGIYQIEFDGASKGNPGHAGAGALIRCPHGSVVLEMTEYLGSETNNVAEYRALILGLKVALAKGIRRVRAQGDSMLVCSQVTGAYKVGNENLISLHEEVKKLESLFEEFSIAHIRRGYNSAADALANEAVYRREPAREVAKPIPECCL